MVSSQAILRVIEIEGRVPSMSTRQILEELPRLSTQELRQIANRLWDLEAMKADKEAMEAAVENAEAGFLMLDELEAADAKSATR
jgi:hypothetical protein